MNQPEQAGDRPTHAELGIAAPASGAAPGVPIDPPSVEQDLVLRSQRGDRAAFEELVRRTARLLYSRFYLETGDAHRAEDLVQETYLVAWRSVRQVTEPSGFRSWLFTVAQSVRLDAGRREGRKKRTGGRGTAAGAEALRDVPDPRPAPPESAERAEQRQRVLQLLRSMPEEYRQPIMLRYLGGADYETIGRQLGLSNGSLRGLLNRGMARLRERMTGIKDEG